MRKGIDFDGNQKLYFCKRSKMRLDSNQVLLLLKILNGFCFEFSSIRISEFLDGAARQFSPVGIATKTYSHILSCFYLLAGGSGRLTLTALYGKSLDIQNCTQEFRNRLSGNRDSCYVNQVVLYNFKILTLPILPILE